MRYRLSTHWIFLAVVAVLVAAGVLRINQQSNVGRLIRDLNRVVPQIEQRNQAVRDLASP